MIYFYSLFALFCYKNLNIDYILSLSLVLIIFIYNRTERNIKFCIREYNVVDGSMQYSFMIVPHLQFFVMAFAKVESPGSVVIYGDGQAIPITFRVSHDGHCSISAVRLSSLFQLLVGSEYVDEEVCDPESGVVTHTIGHDATTTHEEKSWPLSSGTTTHLQSVPS